jgi:hypothetical protein
LALPSDLGGAFPDQFYSAALANFDFVNRPTLPNIIANPCVDFHAIVVGKHLATPQALKVNENPNLAGHLIARPLRWLCFVSSSTAADEIIVGVKTFGARTVSGVFSYAQASPFLL